MNIVIKNRELRDRIKEEANAELCRWLGEHGVDARPKVAFACPNPDHADEHPSAFVTPDGRHVKCFSCGMTADTMQLIEWSHQCDFNGALAVAADWLGFDVTDESGASEGRPRSGTIRAAHISPSGYVTYPDKAPTEAKLEPTPKPTATEPTPSAAPSLTGEAVPMPGAPVTEADVDAAAYLARRGISVETAARCGIRFAPSWLSPSDTRRNPTPTRRLIFPTGVGGARGAYTARDLDHDKNDGTEFAKYCKQKVGTQGYAFADLVTADTVFVCEGETSALSFWQVGFEAVATGSTSRAAKFVEWWAQNGNGARLLLALDRDDAGDKGTAAALEAVRSLAGRADAADVRALVMQAGEDPNDALVRSPDGLRAGALKALASAPSTRLRSQFDYIVGEGFLDDCKAMTAVRGRRWGFPQLDAPQREGGLGGIYPGLYVIGGATSLGKTTFAHIVAENLASAGIPVLYVSLEMTECELASKSIARRIAVDHPGEDWLPTALEVRLGSFETADARRAYAAAVRWYAEGPGRNLYVVRGDAVGTTAEYVARCAERLVREHADAPTPVVIVDYLQLLVPTDPRKNDKQAADEAVRVLKRITDSGAAVIALASLNRANYTVPVSYESFKESGGIEYGVDVLLGLQLEAVDAEEVLGIANETERRKALQDAKDSNPRRVCLTVLKNRYGRPGGRYVIDYDPAHDVMTDGTADKGRPLYHEPTAKRKTKSV